MLHIGSDLCQATKTCSSSRKLFPSSKKKKKVQKKTWRCFKNNESITPGLMFDHKSEMSHVYTSHRNSARASLNGCISSTLHQKLYLRKVLFLSLQSLSVDTSKNNFQHVLVKLEIPSYLRILTKNMQAQVPNRGKKKRSNTWRCFKNNESITPRLMFDHKPHILHVYTGHRNSVRASCKDSISLIWHQKLYLRNVLFSSLYCLSIGTIQLILTCTPEVEDPIWSQNIEHNYVSASA